MAQKLMPGTLASAVGPASDTEASSPSFNTASSSSSDARQPITAQERIDWVVRGTIGPESLAAGLFGAGWGTLFNQSEDVRSTLGGIWRSLWHAPERHRGEQHHGSGAWARSGVRIRVTPVTQGAPFGHRLGHALKMTFLAQNRDGSVMPAYARFIAIPGSNFLSNAWRAPGDDTRQPRGHPHRARIPRPLWQQHLRRILAGRSDTGCFITGLIQRSEGSLCIGVDDQSGIYAAGLRHLSGGRLPGRV